MSYGFLTDALIGGAINKALGGDFGKGALISGGLSAGAQWLGSPTSVAADTTMDTAGYSDGEMVGSQFNVPQSSNWGYLGDAFKGMDFSNISPDTLMKGADIAGKYITARDRNKLIERELEQGTARRKAFGKLLAG